MKELRDIVVAWHEAEQAGQRCALATVVHVEGSSYRRPGARMLVREDGRITGAISGGCLEGDALRKALHAIEQRTNRMVIYDTTDEDDLSFGIQLGCNGIVHLLFEPILPEAAIHPIHLIESAVAGRRDAVLTTLFSLLPHGIAPPGTCFLHRPGEGDLALPVPGYEAAQATADAESALARGESFFRQLNGSESLRAFVELIRPPVALVIAGGGNDTQPLARMAQELGWEVTVIDGRPASVTEARFPYAKSRVVARPEEALQSIACDERTAILLMTHNYHYDAALFQQALNTPCFYIGMLGPREKADRIMGQVEKNGDVPADNERLRLFGPTGLDIGAETSEEIALSILAEVQAVLHGTIGVSLRDRVTPIHRRAEAP